MDPNANLLEQLQIAHRIITGRMQYGDEDRLAELVEALDEWLEKGGFFPVRWTRGQYTGRDER